MVVGGIEDFDAVDMRHIPPDPGVLQAIGLSHDLSTAVADIIDNSLDAHARHILVRLVLRDGAVVRIQFIDDGDGMDDDGIDRAMQLGRPKTESVGTLGFFGVGLKAASFSHTGILTVLSRRKYGQPQGRRLHRESANNGFDCEVLKGDQVAIALDAQWPGFRTSRKGTIVVWDTIQSFPPSRDSEAAKKFVDTTIQKLRVHLGLHLHRLLTTGNVWVGIDVQDSVSGEVVPCTHVEPIDPFDYRRPGNVDYPKTLIAAVGTVKIPIKCYIWPGRSDSLSFRLPGRAPETFQGFFIYRNQRLLSAGGWLGVRDEDRRLRLARVAVDIEKHLNLFTMNAEKSSVRLTDDVIYAIRAAVSDDGTTFDSYLERSEEVFRETNKRSRQRPPVLPPGRGFPPAVKRTIGHQLPMLDGEDPINIKWQPFESADFIRVDRETRTLWLNRRYRSAILNGDYGSLNDAPLVKSLLYLLYEDIFRGQTIGPKEKENIDIWQNILRSAAQKQLADYDK